MAVAEKVKGIIAENLDVDEQEITPDASFTEDLGTEGYAAVRALLGKAAEAGLVPASGL